MKPIYNSACFFLISLIATVANAQVQESGADGFHIEIKRELEVDAETAYDALVNDFSKWYDASHSYSGKAENISIDLNSHCMLETLPDGGFVRHMEMVFHQPGKVFRMAGGLGPLQGLGVSGAMTFAFVEVKGNAKLTMTYHVSGAEHLQLDALSGPVNRVLNGQLDRFQSYCQKLAKEQPQNH